MTAPANDAVIIISIPVIINAIEPKRLLFLQVFEVYDPSGKVAYSFYKEGAEIQDAVDRSEERRVGKECH